MKRKGKLLIGTSGWIYDHWKKIFYPEDLNRVGYTIIGKKYFTLKT